MLNDYFAHDLYEGTLLFRFDDTNPRRRNKNFRIQSLMIWVFWALNRTGRVIRASDYFQTLYEYCIRMIKEGQEDAKLFEQGEEITLMAWGNAIARKINSSSPDYRSPVVDIELELHLEGDVKKTEKKVTWLSTEGQSRTPVELADFDYLLTKDKLEEDDNWEDFLTEQTEFRSAAFCDANLAACKTGDIIQLERKGYFRVDAPYKDGKAAVLFSIPTGKTG